MAVLGSLFSRGGVSFRAVCPCRAAVVQRSRKLSAFFDPEVSTPTLTLLVGGAMGKGKDLSDFEKGQIVMARRLGHSISRTASVVGCSRSAVVSTFRRWSREGTLVNQRQGHGRPRLIDERGERRLARLVQSNQRATVAQIAEEVNAGSDRKVSEHTVHRSLLRLGLRHRRGAKRNGREKGGEGLNSSSGSDPTVQSETGSDPSVGFKTGSDPLQLESDEDVGLSQENSEPDETQSG